MTKIVLVLAVSLVFLADFSNAEACSCVGITTAESVAQADRVVVARVGEEVRTKATIKRQFKVLHTFKGKADPSFTWVQNGASPCAPSYSSGDVVVLFASGESLSLCLGNFGSIQLKQVPALIKASGQKSKTVSLKAMKVALREGLAGYLHERPKVRALYEPLQGKSLQLGKSRIRFGSRSKMQIPLMIEHAHEIGTLILVSGTYGTEGLTFRVLLVKTGKGYQLVHKEVYES